MPEDNSARAVVDRTLAAVQGLDHESSAAVAHRFDGKVKPLHSLGRLEGLAARVAGIQGTAEPRMEAPTVLVCAADHGIARSGVSAYPQEVTGQMLTAFAGGRAAVSVLARQAQARLVVADLGVVDPPTIDGGQTPVLDRRIRAGTDNSAEGPAMSVAEAEAAVAAGIGLAEDLIRDGVDLIALGEMGIGSTTTASVLTSAILDRDPARVVGAGTGVAGEALAHKVEMVDAVLARHADVEDPWEVLAAMGGLEIAALTGVALACAAHRVPALLDGFISTAGALMAWRLEPRVADAMIVSHRSTEPGHSMQLDELGLTPLLDLEMHLGEGSGAALAIPVVRSSLALLREMGELADLGVADGV
ncbi:nicotinate-nucleotide--dimethylbenzimidazole phosphoribosyltransferase [Serinicoccus kebangsaanensis]|uniref:nicotinate-nucleotide--dimethylbenzimidazole phosphoribosyltransferase n=1 Tax=Serinicoccus kebangsaanensis TaxID=2602069 RepID=UPI00124C980A|nr:nicotinate-nucleotide--dimethylbenzimidazole phosphoribosyltransferase [Serinicoccus kebangsaanensis]